jgi:hypothetical protein
MSIFVADVVTAATLAFTGLASEVWTQKLKRQVAPRELPSSTQLKVLGICGLPYLFWWVYVLTQPWRSPVILFDGIVLLPLLMVYVIARTAIRERRARKQ